MFHYGKCVVRALCVSLVCCSLSSCISYGLLTATGGSSGHKSTWKSDTVTGLSLGKDSNGKTGWVFVGKNYDYLLTQGGDKVVALLKDPVIHRENITIQNDVQFRIDKEDNIFIGWINLTYAWTNQKDKDAAMGYGFRCKNSGSLCILSLFVNDLAGTIHEKNKDQSAAQQLSFHHPFNVEFYEYKNGVSMAALGQGLLPLTLVLDAATFPIQKAIFAN